MDTVSNSLSLSSLSTDPTFNVKAVCVRTGITAATLRAWERRHGMPAPHRSAHGYRLYSEREMAIIAWLMQQTEAGVNIGQAVQQLQHLLANQVDLVVKMPFHAHSTSLNHPRSPQSIAGELHEALVNLDELRAEQLITEAAALYTLETVLDGIVRPVFQDIREQSRDHEFPVTIERFAMAYIRRWLLTLIQNAPAPRSTQGVVSLGSPGEHNEIEVLMLGLLLRRMGYPVAHLGTDLSPELLGATLDHFNASALLYYVDAPHNALRLVGFVAPINPSGRKVWCAAAGRALEVAPSLQSKIPFEHVGSELQLIVQRIVKRLNDQLAELSPDESATLEWRNKQNDGTL